MATECLTCIFKGLFPPSSHDDLDTADKAVVVHLTYLSSTPASDLGGGWVQILATRVCWRLFRSMRFTLLGNWNF